MKTCTGCKNLLPFTEFGTHSRDGYQARCKACKKQYQKEWHQANKPRRLLQIKKYQERVKRDLAEQVNAIKNAPCLDCGKRFPAVAMDFDHRTDEVKTTNISELVTQKRAAIEVILKEIEKCDLVCACCHRIRTYNRRNAG